MTYLATIVYTPPSSIQSCSTLSWTNPQRLSQPLSKAPQSRQVNRERADGVYGQPSLHLLAVCLLRFSVLLLVRLDDPAHGSGNDGQGGEVSDCEDGTGDVPVGYVCRKEERMISLDVLMEEMWSTYWSSQA